MIKNINSKNDCGYDSGLSARFDEYYNRLYKKKKVGLVIALGTIALS